MKRTLTLLILTVAFVSTLAVWLVFRSANAGFVRNLEAKEKEEGCTLATLRGDYMVTGRAERAVGQPQTDFPRVFVGVQNFDGAGNTHIRERGSRGGTIDPSWSEAEGTYELNSDCTGSLVWTVIDTGAVVHWAISITKDGSEGNYVRTDDQTLATRSVKKPSRGDRD